MAIGTGAKRSEVLFADMDGDGRDDYLVVDTDTGAVKCWLNTGPDTFDYKGEIAIGTGGVGAGVRFADMDGDGKADYIYLNDGGAATIWINGGPRGKLEQWEVQNGGAPAAIGVGAYRDEVRFADIDGDGLADYIWVHQDTSIEVWYNGGPETWIHGGIVGEGITGNPNQIRFARIGDSGRADLVQLSEDTGGLKVFLNGCNQVIGTTGTPAASCNATGPLGPQSTELPPFNPGSTNSIPTFYYATIGDSYAVS